MLKHLTMSPLLLKSSAEAEEESAAQGPSGPSANQSGAQQTPRNEQGSEAEEESAAQGPSSPAANQPVAEVNVETSNNVPTVAEVSC